VLESAHPYDNNADVYTPVRIPGARKLLISFDEATATERGCDFVQIFKDDSHTGVWGADTYSGDAASGNWPGSGGRPPLEIPGDSFVFHFKTDSSVSGWGYRARVRAEGTSLATRVPASDIHVDASSSTGSHDVARLLDQGTDGVAGAYWESARDGGAAHRVTARFSGGAGANKVEVCVVEDGSYCPNRVDVEVKPSAGPAGTIAPRKISLVSAAGSGSPPRWVSLHDGEPISEITVISTSPDRPGTNIRYFGLRAFRRRPGVPRGRRT
jgi:hypothetical protein